MIRQFIVGARLAHDESISPPYRATRGGWGAPELFSTRRLSHFGFLDMHAGTLFILSIELNLHFSRLAGRGMESIQPEKSGNAYFDVGKVGGDNRENHDSAMIYRLTMGESIEHFELEVTFKFQERSLKSFNRFLNQKVFQLLSSSSL